MVASGGRVSLSVLHVGNLPVSVGPWISQFASDSSRAGGSIGVIRFDREEVIVEVFGTEAPDLPATGGQVLETLLGTSGQPTHAWLLNAGSDNFGFAGADGLDEPILISGADEAAVTAAYLALKQMADAGIGMGRPLTRATVSFAGSTTEQAISAAKRLSDAARSFLGIEVVMGPVIAQLGRLRPSVRRTFRVADFPSAATIVREVARADRERSVIAMRASPNGIDQVLSPHHNDAEIPEPVTRARRAEAIPDQPQLRALTRRPVIASSLSDLPQPLVSVYPELRPLGVACPSDPEIELAIDSAGLLCVIGRCVDAPRLRVVKAWALEHSKLLGLAFPELKGGFEVRERILLGDARDAIVLHGTGALLDVLVVAQTPSGPVQVVVPLNDPTTCG